MAISQSHPHPSIRRLYDIRCSCRLLPCAIYQFSVIYFIKEYYYWCWPAAAVSKVLLNFYALSSLWHRSTTTPIDNYMLFVYFCRPCDRNLRDAELISCRLRRVEPLCRLPSSALQQLAMCGFYEDLEKGVTRKQSILIFATTAITSAILGWLVIAMRLHEKHIFVFQASNHNLGNSCAFQSFNLRRTSDSSRYQMAAH